MKIRIIGHTRNMDLCVPKSSPWNDFLKYFNEAGYEIVNSGSSDKSFEVLITNSHSRHIIKEANKYHVPKSKRVLVCWEPEITNPKLYSKRIKKLYGCIYSPSKEWSQKLCATTFPWPQGALKPKTETFENWRKRENKIVIINSNKYSAVRGELYSLRRKIINKYAKEIQNKLIVYGENWNRGFYFDLLTYLKSLSRTPLYKISPHGYKYLGKKFLNYRGWVKNKNEALLNYRVCLVIENSLDYVSEKLFDAIRAQCIVIYVGSHLNLEKFNRSTFLITEPSVESISRKISEVLSMSPRQQYQIMKNQQKVTKENIGARVNSKVLRNLAIDIHKYLVSTDG